MGTGGAELDGFSLPVRTWFRDTFQKPTSAQEAAWREITAGNHALVVAPTGSGKTLAAFLHALDRLSSAPRPSDGQVQVVYVSPLKALAVDIERNLKAPLAGIARTATDLGLDAPDIKIGIRTGDTSAKTRAALARRPPDILITTPESLYLMLTAQTHRMFAGTQAVIVDEIHSIASGKRGTHLALSLERLNAIAGWEVQRIALSATVRPVEKVAELLGGDRRVHIVNPASEKRWDVRVRLPVADITAPGPAPGVEDGSPEGDAPDGVNSLWPHIEQQVFDAVMRGRSTLVFANSRRTAERLTARLNELWAERFDPDSLAAPGRRPPAQVMAPVDEVGAAPAVLARAHHGSVSKDERAGIEAALKSGELRCVVATSSLELGIDMGEVDRVIQVSSPPSTASALQRIGRAGHHVGAISHGDVYPLHRDDLVTSAVTTTRMLRGEIEELRIPRSPLDVLAQHTVAAAVAAGDDGLGIDDWYGQVTRSMPYADLDRGLFDAVVELLTGTYPSADFGELRARLVENDGRLFKTAGALRLAVTSGGTIPDRGMFGVFLAGDEGPGRRVGELDEEMVYESRVGDVFALGASSWRILEITRDQVLVAPAAGHTGRLPFWRGEQESRPAELGVQVGRFRRQSLQDPAVLELPQLEESVRTNIVSYLSAQQEATSWVPDDVTVVLERFRDEVGEWRFVLHCPLGRAVLAPWALVIGASLKRATGIDVVPVASDDAIIWQLPDSDAADNTAEHVLLDPGEVRETVVDEVGGTALFASRFRECAARALLLPQYDPGRRSPLWLQRQRSAQLLEVARLHPRFPIIIETVREVLQDVYDVPELVRLLGRLQQGEVRLAEVTTPAPSPFAAAQLFRYTGEFVYEEDKPLAERRAAALSVDPELLASALGTVDLREVLDPRVVAEFESELQHTTPGRLVRDAEGLAQLPRQLGPVPLTQLKNHVAPELASALDETLRQLSGRVFVVQLAGEPHVAAASDLALLHDALGVPVPTGAPQTALDGDRDSLVQLISRYARTHAPFTAAQLAAAFGLGVGTAKPVLEREVAAKRLLGGHFTPGRAEWEFVDPEVLRLIRGRCLAEARAQIQPVSTSALARFLASWHGLDSRRASSPDEVLVVLQRLAAAPLPASIWESQVFPARLRDYSLAHLDELIAEGEVLIRIRGSIGAEEPLVSLVPAEDVDLLPPVEPAPKEARQLAEELSQGGGLFAQVRATRELALEGSHSDEGLVELWWRAAQAGLIAPASMAPVRARFDRARRRAGGGSRHRSRTRMRFPRPGRALLARPSAGGVPASVAGRWYRVTDPALDVAEQAIARVSGWLERYGVITRGAVTAEGSEGGFAAAYQVLSELEQAGKLSRGYIVDRLGGAQFTTPETIDHIRSFAEPAEHGPWPSGVARPTPILLSVLDPANPYGSVVPWPSHPTARPARAVGAVVVLADGLCLAHLSPSGRKLTVFAADRQSQPRELWLALIGEALQQAVNEDRLGRLHIQQLDGKRPGSSRDTAALIKAGGRITPRGIAFEKGSA